MLLIRATKMGDVDFLLTKALLLQHHKETPLPSIRTMNTPFAFWFAGTSIALYWHPLYVDMMSRQLLHPLRVNEGHTLPFTYSRFIWRTGALSSVLFPHYLPSLSLFLVCLDELNKNTWKLYFKKSSLFPEQRHFLQSTLLLPVISRIRTFRYTHWSQHNCYSHNAVAVHRGLIFKYSYLDSKKKKKKE